MSRKLQRTRMVDCVQCGRMFHVMWNRVFTGDRACGYCKLMTLLPQASGESVIDLIWSEYARYLSQQAAYIRMTIEDGKIKVAEDAPIGGAIIDAGDMEEDPF